jgi:Tfp pilus assembly protein PilF
MPPLTWQWLIGMPKAMAAAEKALAIDDTLADAHAAIGSASQDLWGWERAEKEFRRAPELNPNQDTALVSE